MELLLLLGQIHQAAGAPLAALPYILSCLLHSTDLHMDLLVSHHTDLNLSICMTVYLQSYVGVIVEGTGNQRCMVWVLATCKASSVGKLHTPLIAGSLSIGFK